MSVIQTQLSLYKITESNFLADEKGSALGKVDVWFIDLLILIHLLTFQLQHTTKVDLKKNSQRPIRNFILEERLAGSFSKGIFT